MTKGRTLSAKDEYYLRRHVKSMSRRVSILEGMVSALETSRHYVRKIGLAIPDAKIDAASYSDPVFTPGTGDATILEFAPDGTDPKFEPVVAERAKRVLLNLHRGMWLWSGVPIMCYQTQSAHWIADNLNTQPVVLGRASGSIPAGGSGSVSVLRGGVVQHVETGVLHDHMDGGVNISDSIDVLIQWFEEDEAWRIINAECEPAA